MEHVLIWLIVGVGAFLVGRFVDRRRDRATQGAARDRDPQRDR